MWPQAQDAKNKDIISSNDKSEFQVSKSEVADDEDKIGPSLNSVAVPADY